MRKIGYYLTRVVAFYLLYTGIMEFNEAEHWIPLFRGLFWMFVACASLWLAPPREDKE